MKKHAARCGRPVYIFSLSVLLVAAVAFLTAGCGPGTAVGDGGTVSTTVQAETTTTIEAPEETTTTAPTNATTTSTAPAADTMTIRVYFSRDEKMCTASRVVQKPRRWGPRP